jgi:hypothetical protein
MRPVKDRRPRRGLSRLPGRRDPERAPDAGPSLARTGIEIRRFAIRSSPSAARASLLYLWEILLLQARKGTAMADQTANLVDRRRSRPEGKTVLGPRGTSEYWAWLTGLTERSLISTSVIVRTRSRGGPRLEAICPAQDLRDSLSGSTPDCRISTPREERYATRDRRGDRPSRDDGRRPGT